MPRIDTDKLNKYAYIVFNRCNYFNDYTLETIGRRIKATGRLSAADQIALKNMADISGDMQAITKKLAEITEQNVKDIEKIYTQTVTEGVNSYKPLFDFKGMEFVPFEQNEYAQFLVKHWAEQTAEQMINLSRTKALRFDKYNSVGEVIGSTPLEGAFQKAIDDAVIAVSSGTTDFNTAMRKTIEQLGGSGIKVSYGSGVNRSLSGMVRQNLLYGAKQSAQAYDEYIGEKLGCDGFMVDYHPHPRPSHEFMGGEIYSYGEAVTIDGVHYESGETALKRMNEYGCRHYKTNIILGVSEPVHSREWLAEQKEKDKTPIEFMGKTKTPYEWTQVQRRFEDNIRRQRGQALMAKASGEKTLERKAKEKIQAYKSTYDDLCKATGLEPRYRNMATYYPEFVDKASKSGIIKEKTNIMPNAITAATSQNKIQNYLLNSNHPTGKHKAEVINSVLGYHYENWDVLSDKIFDAVQKTGYEKIVETLHGTKYVIPISVTGERAQRSMILRTVWQVDKGSNIPRLITITFNKRKGVK